MRYLILVLTLISLSACVTSGQRKDSERPVGIDRKGDR